MGVRINSEHQCLFESLNGAFLYIHFSVEQRLIYQQVHPVPLIAFVSLAVGISGHRKIAPEFDNPRSPDCGCYKPIIDSTLARILLLIRLSWVVFVHAILLSVESITTELLSTQLGL